MPYLSVANFWKYQNADVWKKSKTHPPWFKHYVHRDREMDALPIAARLLWSELLAAATRYSNVLEADLNWLYAETRVDPELIRESLPLLVKGGWIKETRTPRRSRKPSRETLDDPRDLEAEADAEEDADGEENRLPSGSDVQEDSNGSVRQGNDLPFETELEVLKLLTYIGTDADKGTPRVVRAYAKNLPPSAISKVNESTKTAKTQHRARYVVGALKSECAERGVLP